MHGRVVYTQRTLPVDVHIAADAQVHDRETRRRTKTHMTQTITSKTRIGDGPLPGSSSPPNDFDFRGLHLAGLELDDAVNWITAQAHARRQAIVVTPNINHLHLVQVSDQARDAIAGADLQLADGWPIVAASRILRQPLPGRIAGIDLVERLVDGDHEFRVAILGGPSDAALRLAERARRRNQVVLVDELRPGWDDEEPRSRLAQRLSFVAPDLTLVGIGAPQQEILAHELKSAVSGPIICCGAAIEVLAGMRPRAPRILQRLGLEWAFRLAIEPRRLARRYLLAGTTFARLLGAAWALRIHSRSPNAMRGYPLRAAGKLVSSGRSAAMCASRFREASRAGVHPRAQPRPDLRPPAVRRGDRVRTMNHEPERESA
jgi:N-acetylglucosaminyldiphosphoundecaprenol N-acetyl-beta-D-mannosaminyltransferase